MTQIFLLATLDGVAQASILFLIAVGLSLIFGIMRILNVAHGSFYALGAYAAAVLGEYLFGAEGSWLSFPLLVFAAVLVGVPLGAFIERVVLRRIYDKEHSLQLLATFGIFMILEDVQKLVFGVEPYFYDAPSALLGSTEVFDIFYTRYQLFVLPLSAVVVMVALSVFFNRSRQGKLIRAVIEDREVATTLGINASKVYLWTFALGASLAALGGTLASSTTSLVPGIGADAIVVSFAIVASAGLGQFQGAAVTALLIGLAQAFATYLYSDLATVVPYIVMTIILLVKPYGLFGRAEIKRL